MIWSFSEISRRTYFSSYYSKIFHRRRNMNFLVSRAFSPFCFLFHIQKTRNERVLNRAPPFFLRNKFPTNAHKTQMYVVRHEVNLMKFFFLAVFLFICLPISFGKVLECFLLNRPICVFLFSKKGKRFHSSNSARVCFLFAGFA